MGDLKEGFYWVNHMGEEIVAQYYNGEMLIPGNENSWPVECFEIIERVEIRRKQFTPH